MAKVVSITPAIPGWFSVFSEADGSKTEYPVALWTLMEDEDRPGVRWPSSYSAGLAGVVIDMLETDDSAGNFVGHVYRPTH
ncbi:MAG TPA: hypothetical protein VK325_04280 [Pseudoxanthomonas sp.]|nr:hypothetical protein [Pseudoxanthomonas sp.]